MLKMTTRARAFYLLKNRINPILSDFLNPILSDFLKSDPQLYSVHILVIQMVVLLRVQVVLEVLEVLVVAWIRQVCSVCR